MFLTAALDERSTPLGYELNAHPGESLLDLEEALRRYALPVRDRLIAPGERCAIAPRVGRALLAELESPEGAERWLEWSDRERLVVYTINAFPLEDFHATRVKESVYHPPWSHPERADLTNRIATWLAMVLPDDLEGTVSTLGGSYRAWGHDADAFSAIAVGYLSTVAHLARLERETGVTVRLTAEPEPDTTLECAADVIALWKDHLAPLARTELARTLGVSAAEAEATLRRFWNVNLDVCHQSVLFRDPVEEWKALDAEGIRVGKLHITSALRVVEPARPEFHRELTRYDEPRYLHQWVARNGEGKIVRGPDLPTWLEREPDPTIEELRVHFHVPVSAESSGALSTTRDDTARAIAHARAHADPPQLAIETYTWPILAGSEADADARTDAMVRGITEEFRWTLAQLDHSS